MNNQTRTDHKIILSFIEAGTKVLDLGCGDGTLLAILKEQKNCQVRGIEIDEKAIFACVARGITVSQGDIDSGLADFTNKRYDYVILNESLQQIHNPKKVILEALRVGKKVIVGIPNFCHIRARFQIFLEGRVPVTKELPYEWFDTPNLRFLSLKDFRYFCKNNSIKILKEQGLAAGKPVGFRPNLFADVGLYLLEK